MRQSKGGRMKIQVLVWLLCLGIYVEVHATRVYKRSIDTCCDRIFLSASEAIARTQEAVLGVYNWTGTHKNSPYYTKEIAGSSTLFFYFRRHGSSTGDSPGWTVGTELDGNSVYLVTRATSSPQCPVGTKGAYDWDEELDSSFSVDCHNDISPASNQECCLSVWVTTQSLEGAMGQNQSIFLGKYDMAGGFDGYPMYHKNEWGRDAYLYFSKQGDLRKDGWTLHDNVGTGDFSVTTRDRRACPAGIETAFDRDKFRDDSFSIICDTDLVEQTTTEFSIFGDEEYEEQLSTERPVQEETKEELMASSATLLTASQITCWALWALVEQCVHTRNVFVFQ